MKMFIILTALQLVFGLQVMSQTLHSVREKTVTGSSESDNGLYYQHPQFPFVIVSDNCVGESPYVSDSLFDAASRGIRFRVNRSELQTTDPFVSLYEEQLVPWLKSQEMELRQIFIRGAASPEGPYRNNVRLSRERANNLISFLNAKLGQTSQHPVQAQSITEDYGRLVQLMAKADDGDCQRVRDCWLSCKGDEACCKRKLMAMDKGMLWQRLKRDYFPALREARVILWFARKADAKPLVRVDTMVKRQPLFRSEEPAMPCLEPILSYERRHLIAVRTNLIHDFLYVPQFGWAPGANIQLEYYPLRGHYTLNAGFTFISHRRWSQYKFFQVRDLQFEVRRYFKGGGTFIGPYLGAYVHGTVYGIGFSKTKGWEGEGGGGGFSVGYTCRLNRKGNLRLELSASMGFFFTRHDPYIYNHPYVGYDDGKYYYDYYGNADNFKKRNHQFTWFGPTNAGIHITYDIIYRKRKPVLSGWQKGGNR